MSAPMAIGAVASFCFLRLNALGAGALDALEEVLPHAALPQTRLVALQAPAQLGRAPAASVHPGVKC